MLTLYVYVPYNGLAVHKRRRQRARRIEFREIRLMPLWPAVYYYILFGALKCIFAAAVEFA